MPSGSGSDPNTAELLYAPWADFLRCNHILFEEARTVSMGLGFAPMSVGASFHNQTLWGSIGWATPAALGTSVAAPARPVVLVTGDGAHHMTAQETSQFARLNLRTVIFVLNNSGYLMERLLCKNPAIACNDISPWRYAHLPRAPGCHGSGLRGSYVRCLRGFSPGSRAAKISARSTGVELSKGTFGSHQLGLPEYS
jgi:indolepyruvate decarboxylase